LGFLHFSRHQGHAVGMLVYRQLHGMRSVLMKSRTLSAHTQRWGYWVKIYVRLQTIRCGTILLGSPVAAGAPAEARPPRSHKMNKVVHLSDAPPGPTRARPLRYRRRFRGPPHCHACEAA
jgi:hypothetical protein